MMSEKPSVHTKAVRAPFLSSTALVATVEPCTSGAPVAPVTESASSTPCSGADGTDGTFSATRRVPSTAMRSVKVPPTSTAAFEAPAAETPSASGFEELMFSLEAIEGYYRIPGEQGREAWRCPPFSGGGGKT